MDFLSKITKYLIPEEEVEVVETPAEKAKETEKTAKVATISKKVVNGPAVYTNVEPATLSPKEEKRPSLKVYKQANIKILVFEPTNFNDTRFAADALKESIRRLEVCSEVVFNDFNGSISHDDINILRKLKQYRRKEVHDM